MINNKLLKGEAAAGGLVPSENFNTVIYTGTGATQNITGVGFAPDFVWIKKRSSATSAQNMWQDTVRGIGSSGGANILYSDSNEVESTNADTNYFAAFGTDGFTLGGNTYYNGSGETYVAFCFKGGGTPTADNSGGSSPTSGSIMVDGSAYTTTLTGTIIPKRATANTANGFSIIRYDGSGISNGTLNHFLNAAPELYIWKCLNIQASWSVAGSAINSNQGYLTLDTNGTINGDSTMQAPTSSLIRFNTTSNTYNGSGQEWVLYCFHSVAEYSKVGTYTGNGSSDGPTVDCGFEPAFLLIKDTGDSGGGWYMYDNKRNTTNSRFSYLQANSDAAEISTGSPRKDIDFTTTGFKIQNNGAGWNKNNNVFIFYAVAADPDTTTPTLAKSFNIDAYTGNGATQQIGSVNTLFTKYAVFNGSSSYIQTGFTLPADSTMSFSFWLKPFSYLGSGDSYIWSDLNSAGSGASRGLDFRFNSSGDFKVDITTSSSVLTHSMGASALGAWVHLVVTIDGTAVKLYKNGTLVESATSSTSFGTAGPRQVTLGRAGDYTPLAHYKGSMDQLRVFTSTLAASDVTTLYNETQSTSSTLDYPASKGCIILYEFNDNADNTGPNYDGTASNITYDSFLFKPDLVIIKNRETTDGWRWFDTQRGVLNRLESSATSAAANLANSLTAFNNAGFTVGSEATVNTSGEDYVSFSLKMLDNNNNVPVEFDAGDNSATRSTLVSANPSAGMSIVKLNKPDSSADTYNHGLSSIPEMIILKKLGATDDWHVYHKDLGNTVRISLNSTAAKVTGTGVWNSTTPTATLFSLQNQTGGDHIAYCFHSVSGFSKFGTYEGNNPSAVTVSLDFTPQFVMIKNVDSGSNWAVYDTVRSPSNNRNKLVYFDSSEAEGTTGGNFIQINTNEFVTNGSGGDGSNKNGDTFLYWAMKIN